MIRLRIKALMETKGVRYPNKALIALGISARVAGKYLSGKKQTLALKHIDRICLLLRCQPNDLLEWVPDDPTQNDPTQPLQALKPKERFNVNEVLKKMTPEEIRKKLEG